MARVANAHWFFGNLYEELVGVPRLVAASPPGGVLAAGSPARYFLPVAPAAVGSTVALAITEPNRATVTAAACTVAGAALTGWLVRTVTVDLLAGRVPDAERDRVLGVWNRANRVRIVLVGAAAVALAGA